MASTASLWRCRSVSIWSCDNLFILAFWRHYHIPIMIVATTPDTEQIRSITSHAHMPIIPLSPNKHSHTCLFPTRRPARCDALVFTILIALCILRVVLETDNANRTRVLKRFFLRQYRTTATIRITGRPFCKNQLGRPCFCSQERTDSSCQAGSVSQNQIR